MSGRELIARSREPVEALDAQAATSEILRLICQVRSTAQPVFDRIAAATLELFGARSANVFTFDGTLLHPAALASADGEAQADARELSPRPPGRDTAAGRAILTHDVVAIPDVLEDSEHGVEGPSGAGVRSVLAVPLMRDGSPVGAIAVGRAGPGPFPAREIVLLQTFAAQALIAIDKVRLVSELEARNQELTEAVEQQAATSEILRVISRSPSDVQPVFDSMVASATRLCESQFAFVLLRQGESLALAARTECTPEFAAFLAQGKAASRGSATGRAALQRVPVQILDFMADPDVNVTPAHRAEGVRTVLAVPMLRGDTLLGIIATWRREVRPFSQKQIALLQTFADQAVIAIENARLFTELGERNRELTEAVEQQTATSEILRAISRSPTEVPFDTITAAALKLCDATSANMFTFDGELLHVAALAMASPEGMAAVRRLFPRPPDRGLAASRAILTGGVVAIHDTHMDAEYKLLSAAQWGFRSVLSIPLMRDGKPIGAIAVGRRDPGPFPGNQVALLQTFADQAVIAIENVRLFKELEARTTQLARLVEQLRALSEVGQAVSSTLDLETVLSTIVSRATQLASMDGGAIYEYEEGREEFRLHATDKLPDELVEALRSTPIPRGEGALGRLATTGEPVAISDLMDEGMYQSPLREIVLRLGYRSLLAVPLLREDRLLGGLIVTRRSSGEFEPHVAGLLKSFATQSALAIQNARLYREIEHKSRQLEVASRHKSAFLANMSHELRTPLNAIIGFTRIVMRRSQDRLEPKQYENLDKILTSAQSLLSLINAILDLAKVEAGRIELNLAEVQLAPVLEQCMRTVEPLTKDAVTTAVDCDGELPSVMVDEEKLRQIVLNLLSNAAKYTSRGSIQARARAANGSIELAVVDTGIGIAPDKLDVIFEEFEQADAGSTREYGGTGLGLAIARRLARLMGGDITAESAPGAGSTFTLTLPICPAS
jgi:GAF domain-containing protein/anti-sigma regulatory factor (Ser/Thr protein kinase)